ncbi:MAG: ribosome maturation factor RimP [Ruminococcaceae bacterium]|nr:ribosome maturation factor RimP [Oscillospiraceae bacterium]
MAKGQKNIAQTVSALILPTVNDLGYSLWDVEYVKEGASFYLRITIDCQEGVSIDDCEKVHRAIEPILDSEDPIEGSYYLEVSSPGIERVLRTEEHFVAMSGETVVLHLFTAVNGKKIFKGKLLGVDETTNNIVLEENGTEIEFSPRSIARAHLYYDFDQAMKNINTETTEDEEE